MLNIHQFASRKFLVSVAIIAAVFGMLQLNTPAIVDTPTSKEIVLPEQVSAILKRSCYDCHSSSVKLAWYDRIAPASYLVAADINEGRTRFNFSQWDKNTPAVQQLLLWEMVNAIQEGKMPLKSYTRVHGETKVSDSELAVLKEYVNSLPGRHKADTGRIIRPAVLSNGASVSENSAVPLSLNGIPYAADYKNWKIISVTDKYDGGSMRIVYANDIMVKAIKSGKLPFPDGARMVKAVWGKQNPDKDGIVRQGNFQNVQFMIKDRKKFRETEGWGFAKFDGLLLKPFGKNPNFDRTCINCHRLLVSDRDFVFNLPTKKTE